MATLEKIRSKSVFLIVVIGLALLAFIVGDALTNSRNIFGDQTTVAKVGSTKIDYTEYQRKREELNNQYEEARRRNPQQFANFDTQQLGEMALEQLIQQTVIDNAAKKAGVKSSANLLRYYMLENLGNPKVQELMQSLQQSGLAAQTPAQAYDIIFNPKRNGLTEAQVEPMQRAWLAAEKETDQQIAEQIYQRLLAGTVKANDLDMKALYDDYVNTKSVDYAFLPFGNLNEKEYPVTDAELKAKYDEIKGRFAVDEETKEIGFISVTVTPSDKDIAAAKALADQTVAFMNKNAGPAEQGAEEGWRIDVASHCAGSRHSRQRAQRRDSRRRFRPSGLQQQPGLRRGSRAEHQAGGRLRTDHSGTGRHRGLWPPCAERA